MHAPRALAVVVVVVIVKTVPAVRHPSRSAKTRLLTPCRVALSRPRRKLQPRAPLTVKTAAAVAGVAEAVVNGMRQLKPSKLVLTVLKAPTRPADSLPRRVPTHRAPLQKAPRAVANAVVVVTVAAVTSAMTVRLKAKARQGSRLRHNLT